MPKGKSRCLFAGMYVSK